MITTSTGQTPSIASGNVIPQNLSAPAGPTLTMVPASRMAGKIALWSSGDATATDVANAETRAAQSADENTTVKSTAVPIPAGTHPYSFHDMLAMINPLQHIPLLNQIYRHLTGDTINPASQVVGDAVYGGPLGAALSIANTIVTQATGHDMSGNILAFVRGDKMTVPTMATATSPSPATVMRYSDAGNGQRLVYEKMSAAVDKETDRMAGSIVNIRLEPGNAADGMALLAKTNTANQVAAITPAAGAATYAPRQSAFRSLHLNA